MADGDEVQRISHRLVNLRQILLVVSRNDDGLDAVAERRHRLFLETADGQHTPPDRDLARHGDVAPNRCTGQRRNDGCADRNARRRAILRDSTLGEVNMDVLRLIKIGRNAEMRRPRADVAHRRLDGFLHHIAEIARQLQLAGAIDHVDLDLQRLAADRRPRKSRHKADRVACRQLVRQETAHAEIALQICPRHAHALRRVRRHEAHRTFAAERRQLTLEISDAGLSCIARDDLTHGLVRHADAALGKAVLFHLLRKQVALRDL